ncbi:alkane hydroxylase MAH1-like [Lotus japonicus]|uniref:alkane hydroxylase MAH1-like n=1 Tax=Lotus japonicus TaxID=34305 RepID=UPI00258740E2|nr:alkane hydroxylase MAH1-like [Lotus japonicus]
MIILECIAIFAAILFFIFINNWRFNRHVIIPNWPITGMLPAILNNLRDIHEFVTLVLKHHGGTLRFEGPWLTNTNFIITSDPMNVHYITSKNFRNYGKGSDFIDIFEIFGGGIFNTDSHEWKKQRSVLHAFFKNRSFENFLQQFIVKKVESSLLPFLDHASKVESQVELQDIFGRFAFDTTCTILFGSDPHCLPNKFTHYQLSDLDYLKAIHIIEDVQFYRHITPACVWKLQKWLQIGPEKMYKVAQKNIYQFLHECIAHSKIEKSGKNLLEELIKEEDGIGESMDEKYLRDIAMNLLIAGNSTISAGLSWFFWLVSTHPNVEAKILQEIKDNFSIKQENWIPSSVEDLGKLVYLHGAICEALRLFPPVQFEHKCAIESDILPSGDRVDANMKVIYSLYSMGRMEHIWGEDCLDFKPERWISERGHIVHMPSYKFITFNAGPRSCLGKDIALIEMKMVAAAILLKFRIQVVDGHPVTPRISVNLRMKYGLKVKVTKRCI